LRKLIGGSALLLGGYKALTAFPSLRPYKIPLGIGAGAAGLKWLGPASNSHLQTDEGFAVPDITEWSAQPKQAADNLSAIVVNLIEEYAQIPPTKLAARMPFGFDERIKRAGFVDSLKGLCLDLDTTAEVLGEHVCLPRGVAKS
jgi:hypothetical protein